MNFTVMQSAVEEFLAKCGFDGGVLDVREIVITARGVKITQLRRNEEGHHFVVDDDVATIVTTLRVE